MTNDQQFPYEERPGDPYSGRIGGPYGDDPRVGVPGSNDAPIYADMAQTGDVENEARTREAVASDDPAYIRARIEQTRSELSRDVDALGDKVDPNKIAQRQGDRLKSKVTGLKDRVMGAADDAQGTAERAGEATADAAERVMRKAEGNPFAVGLMAFGAGLLVASLIPASRKETELAASARDAAQPLVDEVKGVAQEAAEHLKEPAQEAANAVKEQATDSVQSLRSDTMSEAQGLQSEAEQARNRVQDQT